MIRIIINETDLRHGSFNMRLEDGTNLGQSRQPLLDGAREVLRQTKAFGKHVNPNDRIAIRHEGSNHDSLISTVGAAAKLRVEETGNGPRFRMWEDKQTIAQRTR